MFFGKTSRKAIALTLLLVFTFSTFAPSMAYALTSGPTQPEATNFEPIDTTDMVNMQSGDFTYNIPLLEVPGPDGNYPLALSYHAGIQPNMDASWVGLGWSLNPGAIARSVNGYPDDWDEPTSTIHTYWNGGTQTTYSVGISVGIAETPATVGFGLSFASDTYRGFGVGFDATVGWGFRIGNQFGLDASLTVGVNPYGGAYLGANLGIGYEQTPGGGRTLTASLGISAMTNFKTTSAGFTGGIGYSLGSKNQESFGGSLLGVTLSTGGNKPSFEIGGMTNSISNSNASRLTTHSSGFSVGIPVWYGVNLQLGYNKVRYWTNESQNVTTTGGLYNTGFTTVGQAAPNNIAYDEYSLPEAPNYRNIVDYPDPTIVQGGSFPEYDEYSVNAQGLAGNMRPYMFEGALYNQNQLNQTTPLVTYYSPLPTNYTPYYRFENDFSNRFMQGDNSSYTYANPSLNLRYVVPPLDGSPVWGNGDGNYGGSQNSNNLAGSRHVDIGPAVHPLDPLGYVKTDRYQSAEVEGFSITNESGVTYHFGLPAYSYNEENYQESLDPQSGSAGNRTSRPTPYAYTWYLTTITGPDYVDRNGDGIADDGDWGYWVDFEYGKWGNEYNWRNPSDGYQRDEDNQFQDCSMGTKEIYYLNAIRTRTHIAIFEKGIRNDGKGESPSIFQKNVVNGINENYLYPGAFDVNSSQSLKLAHIYLLNIADSAFVTAHSGSSAAYQPPAGSRQYPCNDCELAQNTVDSFDVAAVGRSALEAKAIRVIDFNYDYSLCPGTENSFNIDGPYTRTGKLTLNSINFRGKGGSTNFPNLIFGYDLPASGLKTATGATVTPTQFSTTAGNFMPGDMIMNSNYPYTYFGVVTALPTLSGGVYTYPLANSTYVSGPNLTVNVQTTKNPAYDKDAYDSWGMYKSDINMSLVATNENLYRQTSVVSSLGADAWCLRTITSQMGGQTNIGYESDSYSGVVIPTNYPFVYTNLTTESGTVGSSNSQIKFTLNNNIGNILSYFQVGGQGSIVLAPQYTIGCLYSTVTVPILTNYTVTNIETNTGIVHVNITTPIPGTAPNSSIPFWDGCVLGQTGTWNGNGTGNVSPSNSGLATIYGGGIRVNSISNTDNAGVQYFTNYSYIVPSTSSLSSGATTYTPSVLDAPAITTSYLGASIDDTSDYNRYRRVLYSQLSSLYAIARELPPPSVMYQYVTVTNMIQNPDEETSTHRLIEGSTLYQFEVPRANMVAVSDLTGRTGPTSTSWGTMNTRNMALMKFTTSIGNLVRTVQYDNLGNKLSETVNHYLHENLANLPASTFFPQYDTLLKQYNHQGYLQERFSEVKEVQNQPVSANNGVFAGLFEKRTYPCIQTGQSVINYVNGTQTKSTNVAFDFYSGAVTEKVETDAYGNNIMTQTIPAYRISQNSAMGVKSYLDANKNMLSQTGETYKWTVDGNNAPLELISAQVNTWSDAMTSYDINGAPYSQQLSDILGDVWRMQSTYSWMPSSFTVSTTDGLTPYSSFVDFNWATPSSSNVNWKNTSTITRYDVYSKALEASDINGNYTATKMDYGDNKVILTGGPANYYEIAFSGAEDAALNQTGNIFVQAGNGTQTNAAAHTGTQSLLLGVSGQKGFEYTIPTSNLTSGRTYQASVWVKPTSGTSSTVQLQYTVNGTVTGTSTMTSGNSTKTANGWSLVNLIINGSNISPGNTLSVYAINNDASIQAYVDDFRFQPINASTTAYVYDPFSGELDYILDNSNIYTKYNYDGAGRLIAVYKEKLGVGAFETSSYQYNYATYSNAAINQNYTVNDCGPQQQGTVVSVSIPAGTYTSSVSQATADALAQSAAQNQANAQGSCQVVNSVTVATGDQMAIVIKDGNGNTIYSGTFSAGSQNLPAFNVGTYNVNVIQTNGVSHNVSITNNGTQSGTNVTFASVSFTSPLTISDN
jgi:hypothetical protein